MSNAERLLNVLAEQMPEATMEVNEASIEGMAHALGRLADDDFVTELIGEGGFNQSWTGVDGMCAALADWTAMFSEMTFAYEGLEEVGDNVVILANQIGKTRHGGVELTQPSAIVVMFRDGRVYRTEWHLDREAARRAATEA